MAEGKKLSSKKRDSQLRGISLAHKRRRAAERRAITLRELKAVGTLTIGLVVGVAATFFVAHGQNDQSTEINPQVAFVVLVIGALAAMMFLVPWLIEQRRYLRNQNDAFDQRLEAERDLHAKALEKLRLASELETLMQLNQDQIKTYHDIVTEQADKSFKSSRTAMRVGLFLLVCAAVGGAFVPLEQVRWFIGALAAFSTLLSGFLSKTYLTLYKEAIGQLNRYFDQPVLNSYYLAAERLIVKLGPESQDEARKQVIDEMLINSGRMGSKGESQKEEAPKRSPKKRTTKKQSSSMNGTPQA
ncbi:hypothetical protein [Streptomyces sp. NPDC088794]|uniref:hypothetical protein n=1 Tax=Streptomyces sp. NPDC088794 TaxID=3365902 RepID=UPI003822E08C